MESTTILIFCKCLKIQKMLFERIIRTIKTGFILCGMHYKTVITHYKVRNGIANQNSRRQEEFKYKYVLKMYDTNFTEIHNVVSIL